MTKLSSRDEALRIIETFDALPSKRKVEIFRDLSPEAREELLEVASRPWEIVRQISEEEIYFTVKSVGRDKMPALIAMTTGEQLRHLIDMDLWTRDIFDPTAASEWLKIITSIGEEKVLQFLETADPELIVMILSGLIRVSVRDPDIDHLEELDQFPTFTLDNIFFIEFNGLIPEELVKRFLSAIYKWNPEYYYTLVQQMVAGVDPRTEEMALKWCRARLADKGFPDFDEALEIYSFVPREAISPADRESRQPHSDDDPHGQEVLIYPLVALNDDSLFKKSLDRVIDPDERQRLLVQLAHLANKVMVADVKDPGSIGDLTNSIKKVSGYINICLEEIGQGNIEKAIEAVESNHMEMLFRRGFSLVAELQRLALRFVKQLPGGVENSGYPLGFIIKGLLQKRPVFTSVSTDGPKSREFESLSDLKLIKGMINRKVFQENWELL